MRLYLLCCLAQCVLLLDSASGLDSSNHHKLDKTVSKFFETSTIQKRSVGDANNKNSNEATNPEIMQAEESKILPSINSPNLVNKDLSQDQVESSSDLHETMVQGNEENQEQTSSGDLEDRSFQARASVVINTQEAQGTSPVGTVMNQFGLNLDVNSSPDDRSSQNCNNNCNQETKSPSLPGFFSKIVNNKPSTPGIDVKSILQGNGEAQPRPPPGFLFSNPNVDLPGFAESYQQPTGQSGKGEIQLKSRPGFLFSNPKVDLPIFSENYQRPTGQSSLFSTPSVDLGTTSQFGSFAEPVGELPKFSFSTPDAAGSKLPKTGSSWLNNFLFPKSQNQVGGGDKLSKPVGGLPKFSFFTPDAAGSKLPKKGSGWLNDFLFPKSQNQVGGGDAFPKPVGGLPKFSFSLPDRVDSAPPKTSSSWLNDLLSPKLKIQVQGGLFSQKEPWRPNPLGVSPENPLVDEKPTDVNWLEKLFPPKPPSTCNKCNASQPKGCDSSGTPKPPCNCSKCRGSEPKGSDLFGTPKPPCNCSKCRGSEPKGSDLFGTPKPPCNCSKCRGSEPKGFDLFGTPKPPCNCSKCRGSQPKGPDSSAIDVRDLDSISFFKDLPSNFWYLSIQLLIAFTQFLTKPVSSIFTIFKILQSFISYFVATLTSFINAPYRVSLALPNFARTFLTVLLASILKVVEVDFNGFRRIIYNSCSELNSLLYVKINIEKIMTIDRPDRLVTGLILAIAEILLKHLSLLSSIIGRIIATLEKTNPKTAVKVLNILIIRFRILVFFNFLGNLAMFLVRTLIVNSQIIQRIVVEFFLRFLKIKRVPDRSIEFLLLPFKQLPFLAALIQVSHNIINFQIVQFPPVILPVINLGLNVLEFVISSIPGGVMGMLGLFKSIIWTIPRTILMSLSFIAFLIPSSSQFLPGIEVLKMIFSSSVESFQDLSRIFGVTPNKPIQPNGNSRCPFPAISSLIQNLFLQFSKSFNLPQILPLLFPILTNLIRTLTLPIREAFSIPSMLIKLFIPQISPDAAFRLPFPDPSLLLSFLLPLIRAIFYIPRSVIRFLLLPFQVIFAIPRFILSLVVRFLNPASPVASCSELETSRFLSSLNRLFPNFGPLSKFFFNLFSPITFIQRVAQIVPRFSKILTRLLGLPFSLIVKVIQFFLSPFRGLTEVILEATSTSLPNSNIYATVRQ